VRWESATTRFFQLTELMFERQPQRKISHPTCSLSHNVKRIYTPVHCVRNSTGSLKLLSALLFSPFEVAAEGPVLARSGNCLNVAFELVANLSFEDLKPLTALATSNHVIQRSFKPLRQCFEVQGRIQSAEWVANAVEREHERIDHALGFLEQVCTKLEEAGLPVTVIKSLDHWPDLGSDLDLYTDAKPANVIDLMTSHFRAKLAHRSWGDKMANKWNFIVPGLPELVEIHICRLGQTGEQTAVTRPLVARARMKQVGRHRFRVPAPEEQIVISTLQRMYRHFYIRLCDIVDNAGLVESQLVDFVHLRSLGSRTGLWDGIATYLWLISEYVERYREAPVPLPSFVTDAARFALDSVYFRRDFLRVPIVPYSLSLYMSELKVLLLNGQLSDGFRLSLLPCLATAAALEQKITGSDKGIW